MKRFLSILLSIAVSCQMIFFAVSAEDFAGHWAEEAIRSLIAESVIGGDQNGNINPDEDITRAEFAKTVNRAFKLADKAAENFADVSAEAWYYEEFLIAKHVGYLTGDTQGNAEPDRNITRAEACVILSRILTLPQRESTLPFGDAAQIPDWARQAVSLLKENGLISGYDDGTFQPSNPITRAEAFYILWQAGKISETPIVTVPPTSTPLPTTTPSVVIRPGGSAGSSSGSGGGGGGSSTVNELAVPIPKLLADTYTYSWERVKNASSYLVKLDFEGSSKEISTTQTSVDLTKEIQAMASESGEKTVTLQVCVKAVGTGRYQDSDYSGKTEFIYSSVLSAPVAELSEKGYLYSWKEVKNASSYLVKLDFEEESREISTAQTNAELLEDIKVLTASYLGAKATMQVCVKAIGAEGYEDSEYCEKTEFIYQVYNEDSSGELGLKVTYSENEAGEEMYCAQFDGTADSLTVRSAAGTKQYDNPASPFDLSDAIKDENGKIKETDYIITVNAGEKSDTIVKDFVYGGGEGTEESPFEVANERHFNNIHKNLDAFFVQSKDFSGGDQLVPVSVQSGAPFTGSYTADGLKNIEVALTGGEYPSLFGQVKGAVIRNIGVTGTIESTVPYTAGIAGLAEEAQITDCENSAVITVSGSGIAGGSYTGGIVGKIDENSTLSDCVNKGALNVQAPFAGGIAGEAACLVERCENSGTIYNDNSVMSGTFEGAVGGVIGLQKTNAGIVDCRNSGKVENHYNSNVGGNALLTGGIAGQAGVISNCVNETGAVVLSSVLSGTPSNSLGIQTGGIVGYHLNGSVQSCKNYGAVQIVGYLNSYCGGIAGFDRAGSIAKCANLGSVNGAGRAGGIVGRSLSGTVDQCYNAGDITNGSYGGGLVGHADASSTYTNSFNTGKLLSARYCAGLVGTLGNSVTVKNCYSVPAAISVLTAINNAGKIATAGNIYYVKVNKETDAVATEVTADELSNAEAPLAGFENSDVWFFDADSGYAFPQLVNNPYEG